MKIDKKSLLSIFICLLSVGECSNSAMFSMPSSYQYNPSLQQTPSAPPMPPQMTQQQQQDLSGYVQQQVSYGNQQQQPLQGLQSVETKVPFATNQQQPPLSLLTQTVPHSELSQQQQQVEPVQIQLPSSSLSQPSIQVPNEIRPKKKSSSTFSGWFGSKKKEEQQKDSLVAQTGLQVSIGTQPQLYNTQGLPQQHYNVVVSENQSTLPATEISPQKQQQLMDSSSSQNQERKRSMISHLTPNFVKNSRISDYIQNMNNIRSKIDRREIQLINAHKRLYPNAPAARTWMDDNREDWDQITDIVMNRLRSLKGDNVYTIYGEANIIFQNLLTVQQENYAKAKDRNNKSVDQLLKEIQNLQREKEKERAKLDRNQEILNKEEYQSQKRRFLNRTISLQTRLKELNGLNDENQTAVNECLQRIENILSRKTFEQRLQSSFVSHDVVGIKVLGVSAPQNVAFVAGQKESLEETLRNNQSLASSRAKLVETSVRLQKIDKLLGHKYDATAVDMLLKRINSVYQENSFMVDIVNKGNQQKIAPQLADANNELKLALEEYYPLFGSPGIVETDASTIPVSSDSPERASLEIQKSAITEEMTALKNQISMFEKNNFKLNVANNLPDSISNDAILCTQSHNRLLSAIDKYERFFEVLMQKVPDNAKLIENTKPAGILYNARQPLRQRIDSLRLMASELDSLAKQRYQRRQPVESTIIQSIVPPSPSAQQQQLTPQTQGLSEPSSQLAIKGSSSAQIDPQMLLKDVDKVSLIQVRPFNLPLLKPSTNEHTLKSQIKEVVSNIGYLERLLDKTMFGADHLRNPQTKNEALKRRVYVSMMIGDSVLKSMGASLANYNARLQKSRTLNPEMSGEETTMALLMSKMNDAMLVIKNLNKNISPGTGGQPPIGPEKQRQIDWIQSQIGHNVNALRQYRQSLLKIIQSQALVKPKPGNGGGRMIAATMDMHGAILAMDSISKVMEGMSLSSTAMDHRDRYLSIHEHIRELLMRLHDCPTGALEVDEMLWRMRQLRTKISIGKGRLLLLSNTPPTYNDIGTPQPEGCSDIGIRVQGRLMQALNALDSSIEKRILAGGSPPTTGILMGREYLAEATRDLFDLILTPSIPTTTVPQDYRMQTIKPVIEAQVQMAQKELAELNEVIPAYFKEYPNQLRTVIMSNIENAMAAVARDIAPTANSSGSLNLSSSSSGNQDFQNVITQLETLKPELLRLIGN